MDKTLLTAQELQRLPGFREFSVKSILRWAKEEGLPHYQVGKGENIRFIRLEAMCWFEEHRKGKL